MHRLDPTTAVLEIVADRYQGAVVTFLSGSVMRGESTEASDLDIVVVYERVETAYRESFVHGGWPVEAFVHDPETLRYFFFKADYARGIPSLSHMVATGVPLPRSNDLSKALQVLAQENLFAGPPIWTDAQVSASRYAITNLVDDLRSPRSRAELTASGVALYSALAELFLRGQGLWFATGKGIPRPLESADPALAARFADAFAQMFETGQAETVIQLCEEILKPYGGWLLDDQYELHWVVTKKSVARPEK
jgi:Nucleotidyltransferase domain